jgi:hypothetical protein
MLSQTIQLGKCDGSITSQGHALKEGVNVPHIGQHSDDFNTTRNRQVKNQIVANWETAQSGYEFVPTGADIGELCEGCTPFVMLSSSRSAASGLSWAICHQISSRSASACGHFST